MKQYQDVLTRVYAEQERIEAIIEELRSAPDEQWKWDSEPYKLYEEDVRKLGDIEERATKVVDEGWDHLDRLNEAWVNAVEESGLILEANLLRREIEELERHGKDR